MNRNACLHTVTLASATLALALSAFASADSLAMPPSEELQARIIEISERVKPSVVHVEAIVRINDNRNQVTGSGLIASPEGLIITNHHVVERSEKVEVTVPGHKKRYRARVLGTDKQTDIAVLQIEPNQPLPAAHFDSNGEVRVGQWVLAIGNPYGLDGTVSFGIVSAKGRNLEIPDLLNDFIQTDAMIDRGSSGGPLVDLEGRVVGINSRGQGRGIGFTIPIDTVLEVIAQIQDGGVERGWLGITIQPLNRDLASYFGVPSATGVIVNGVVRESPAERGKLATGDIITAVNGAAVEAEKDEDLGNFQRRVAHLAPGEKVTLEILRDGRPRSLEVKLGVQPKVEPEEAESDLGFHVQEITENLYRDQRLLSRSGAYVSFVARGSPADEAGLRAGDVVESIEKREVPSIEAFEQAMKRLGERPSILIEARRGADLKFLLVKRGAGKATPEEPEPEPGEAAHPEKSTGEPGTDG